MKQEPNSDNETDSDQHETIFSIHDNNGACSASASEFSPFKITPCDPLDVIGRRDVTLDNLLTKFFIENDIPFKAVKSSYLTKFVQKLRPDYKLPDPIAMKTSILEQVHDEAVSKANPEDKIAFIKSFL